MIVDVKLKFDNARELERMIDLLWKIECPLKGKENCDGCFYHESCLKLREITKRLEIANVYEK